MTKWIIAAMMLAISACNDPAPKMSKETAALDDSENLRTLIPYSKEKLATFLPVTLGNLNLISVDVDETLGALAANGTYHNEANQEVILTIFDCAGDAGSGIYSTQYLMRRDMKDNIATDINSKPAVAQKENGISSIVWMLNDRLLARLESETNDVIALATIARQIK